MLKIFFQKYKLDFICIVILSFIAFFSHTVWFLSGTTISFADIWFQHNETLKESLFTNVWVSSVEFGTPNIQLFKVFFTSIWGGFAQINFSYTDVLKITHLIPTAILGFVAPYILFRHFFEEKPTAFMGALFYGSATPFLIRQYQGHASVAFIIAIFPIVLYLFSAALKKNTYLSWLLFALTYVVGVCYELRIMYIVTIILALYFLFFGLHSFKTYLTKFIFFCFLFLTLSAFWTLPLFFGNFSQAIQDVAGRDLFGNTHFSILRSLALFQPYWTGTEPKIFELQPIPFYFWFVPVTVLVFFLFRPDKKHNKILNFFGIVAVIGLLLTKQVGEPLPHIFQWLRDNIPGFLAFRSGSKFWFILTFSYAGVLVYGLTWLYKRTEQLSIKIIFYICSFLVVGVSLLNLKPAFLGEFGGMFQTREIPSDYIIFKKYLQEDNNFSRIFWIPLDSRWSFYSQIHPKLSNGNLYSTFWKKYFVLVDHSQIDPLYKMISELYRHPISPALFDSFSVKYVVVSLRDIDNDDDFFIYYGAKMDQNIRDWYISELKRQSWLEQVDIGTKELVVFENKNYKPHIAS